MGFKTLYNILVNKAHWRAKQKQTKKNLFSFFFLLILILT